jgi:type VI protein secretion system component VasK
MWKIVFGSVLALLAAMLVILWPVFNAAGPAPGTAMALAVVVLSLIPLLLLRTIWRRPPRPQAAENAQAAENSQVAEGSEALTTEGKDRRYLLQRAAEEVKMARESKDPAAAVIHRRLAKLYVDDAEARADEDKK